MSPGTVLRLLAPLVSCACAAPHGTANAPRERAAPPTMVAPGDPDGVDLSPFFGEVEHDPSITTPEALLGRRGRARGSRTPPG